MNKRLLASTLRDKLAIEGFELEGKGAGVISLVRIEGDITSRIVFSYRKYPGEFILAPYVTGWVSFTQVEDILKKYYLQNELNYLSVTIHGISKRVMDIENQSLKVEEDIDVILPYLTQLINGAILPFFDKFRTIGEIHTEIERLDKSELSKFIFNPPLPRIMIIKRLAEANDWESYCEWAIDVYRQMSSGPYSKQHAPIYAFLPALYEELKGLTHTA